MVRLGPHRRPERLKGWDERQKAKEKKWARRNRTVEERDEAKKQLKWKAARELEFDNGQEMKTMSLCFLRRGAQSCSASTAAALSQCKQEEKRQNGGKAEATMERKRSEWVGKGTGGRRGGRRGPGGGSRVGNPNRNLTAAEANFGFRV